MEEVIAPWVTYLAVMSLLNQHHVHLKKQRRIHLLMLLKLRQSLLFKLNLKNPHRTFLLVYQDQMPITTFVPKARTAETSLQIVRQPKSTQLQVVVLHSIIFSAGPHHLINENKINVSLTMVWCCFPICSTSYVKMI